MTVRTSAHWGGDATGASEGCSRGRSSEPAATATLVCR